MKNGFKVSLSPGAAAAAAAALLIFDSELLLCLVISVLCHELGHFLALSCFGAEAKAIHISAAGLAAEYDRAGLSYFAEIVCAAAGPVFGAVLTVCAAGAGAHLLAGTSFLLTVFNLLPAYPLDGGRILAALSSYLFGVDIGTKISCAAGMFTAAVLFVFGVVLSFSGHGGVYFLPVSIWLMVGYCKSSGNGVK